MMPLLLGRRNIFRSGGGRLTIDLKWGGAAETLSKSLFFRKNWGGGLNPP